MKLDAGRVDAFLKTPAAPIVLLHGPDAGLVAERGLALARSVPGALNDPFRFAELNNPAPDTLLAEASAASLTGGKRVVRVRDAHEPLVKALETLLKTPPEALVILEAGELTPKSKLRALGEKSPDVAVIACYAIEPAKLPQIISARLRGMGVSIDQDAAAWCGQNLSGEEGPLSQALEVLFLYAGENKTLSLGDVSDALTDGGDTSMGEAIDAALTGDPAATDKALALAYEEGTAPVGLLRVLLGELLRLRVAAGAMAQGASAQEAMAGMRPPVFFKRQPAVQKMLRFWPLPALDQAIAAALAAEAACKTTHIPDQAYCRQTLLALATRARSAARR
ncbi:DNA polymerase III subunit delta [Acidocella aromatica]|uniref:DNA-directed DNA polymerase n=1 Tax=Acidocella aromatica TaxID=1303579 RepID=A0A840VFB7_9PROT|nr:DNA polymerase III subunit delta [Acidocella aromatica]MBB5373587.1 DNA polymerase-3 subunit delta [Acidocella aromatica]